MMTETLSYATANGDSTAFAAMPDADGEKAVLVIQEWWGVNDHIKDIAGRYANEGFIAVAPDLYRGTIAKTSDEASKLMHDLKLEDGLDTIRSAMSKAREAYGITHFGITGYCMGGTVALELARSGADVKVSVPSG